MAGPEVLLTAINAKYIHSNLAVYSLMANAGQYEDMVTLCEYTVNHRREEILSRLYGKKPAVIGFSCYLWNVEYVVSLAEDLKKVLPDLVIFAGGPEVSWHPERFLERHPFFDMIMVGEGEETFREYLAWLAGDAGALSEVRGLVYREGARIVRTEPRPALDMEKLSFPYRSLEAFDNRILYYESMRGCPFSCSYCLSSLEKTVRVKSIGKTQRELDFFLEGRVPQVKFVDRTFNCDHEHAYAIWEYIGAHDNGVTNFHFEIAGDLLREEDFALFEGFRPGLIQFEIGVQSTNPDTLAAIRRTMDLGKLCRAMERLHRGRNIHAHLDLIAGLPHEDYGSFRRSFDEVYAMKPDQLQLGFLKVLDGSHMSEAGEEYGIVYSSAPPYEVFSTKWLSYGDLLQLKIVEEMVEVYYNSFQFAASMAFLRIFSDTAFDLYRSLGGYYERHGWLEKKHSRLERYEILWRFAEDTMSWTGEQREQFRQAMTYDFYCRDYVKNPPAFIRPRPEQMKRGIRAFFAREAQERRFVRGYEGMKAGQLYHLLYVDCFTLDMEILTEERQIRETPPRYCMFDYRKRNPLNRSAEIIPLGGSLGS